MRPITEPSVLSSVYAVALYLVGDAKNYSNCRRNRATPAPVSQQSIGLQNTDKGHRGVHGLRRTRYERRDVCARRDKSSRHHYGKAPRIHPGQRAVEASDHFQPFRRFATLEKRDF